MKISVFVTSYNQKTYLKEAIDSVLAQSLAPAQIIVVDDASSDDSVQLIESYKTRYPELFTPVYHATNTGVSQARIDALKAVTGDYVTYVDGDDWFMPDKLEKEAAALAANPGAGIAFSNNEYVNEDGSQRVRLWVDGESVPQGDVFWNTVARAFPRRSLFRMELVNYAAWKQIGFHDPALALYEDFDMRIRLTRQLKVVYVDAVLSRIRTHGTGLSSHDPGRHFVALDYLFHKNRPLWASMPTARRRAAESLLAGWILRAGRQGILRAVRERRLLAAARLGWEMGPYLLTLGMPRGAGA